MDAHANQNKSLAVELFQRYSSGEDVSQELQEKLDKYAWYHPFEIVPGIKTKESALSGVTEILVAEFRKVATEIDFSGKRVLDVGCRDGAQLFIAEEFGASELVGIDNDMSRGLTEFLIPFRKSKIQCFEKNLFDMTPEEFGKFDVVICCGLLYHLRYPIWGLKKLANMLKPGGRLILETGAIDAFGDCPLMLYTPDTTSPYEITSPTFFNLPALRNALKEAGFSNIKIPADKVLPYPYPIEKHYPVFSRETGIRVIDTMRTITTAELMREKDNSYFEGTHSFHNTHGS